jgi:hypothetical protein
MVHFKKSIQKPKRVFSQNDVDDICIIHRFLYMPVCSEILVRTESNEKERMIFGSHSVEGEASRHDERYLFISLNV